MQEDLRHSEERYPTLVDWSRGAIAVQRQGKLLFVNPAAIKMMAATSASDLIGKSALELVHPDFREGVSQRLNREINASDPLRVSEEKLVRLDGMVIGVEVQSMPILYGGAPAILGSMRDITERKRLVARFRRLTDSNAERVLFWNMARSIIDCNDVFLTLLGFTRVNLGSGLGWTAITPPEYASADHYALEAVVGSGNCATYEKELIRYDGARIPL